MSEKEALLKLLEDEDPKIATIAISKLLQYGPDIFPALRDLQESVNPLVRKRVHQIEAILEKKINFSHFINNTRFVRFATSKKYGRGFNLSAAPPHFILRKHTNTKNFIFDVMVLLLFLSYIYLCSLCHLT